MPMYSKRDLPGGGAIYVKHDTGLVEEIAVRAEDVQFIDSAPDEAEMWQRVLDAKMLAEQDWKANRGPDSDLGRNLEQGTPTSDHSSDS